MPPSSGPLFRWAIISQCAGAIDFRAGSWLSKSTSLRPVWREDCHRRRRSSPTMQAGVVACLLWLACSLAGAQNPTASTHGNETVLIALENGWNQAQLHHDSKALELFLADTFISTDNEGILMTKAQFLADNEDLSYAASLMTNSGVQVFSYGDVAVVVGIYHAKGLNKGKPFDHYGRFTDTWAYLNGKWLCAATHTSALKKKP